MTKLKTLKLKASLNPKTNRSSKRTISFKKRVGNKFIGGRFFESINYGKENYNIYYVLADFEVEKPLVKQLRWFQQTLLDQKLSMNSPHITLWAFELNRKNKLITSKLEGSASKKTAGGEKTIKFLSQTLRDRINEIYDTVFLDEKLSLILKPTGQFHKLGEYIAMVYEYEEKYEDKSADYIPAITRFRNLIMNEIAKMITDNLVATSETTFDFDVESDPEHTLVRLKNRLGSPKSESPSTSAKAAASAQNHSAASSEMLSHSNKYDDVLFAVSNYNLLPGVWKPHVSLARFDELKDNNFELYKEIMAEIIKVSESKGIDISKFKDDKLIRKSLSDKENSEIINPIIIDFLIKHAKAGEMTLSQYEINMKDKLKFEKETFGKSPADAKSSKKTSKKQKHEEEDDPDKPIEPIYKDIKDKDLKLKAIADYKKALEEYNAKKERERMGRTHLISSIRV